MSRFTIHGSRFGFTLLELIVVVFILSIALAVSLPSFTGIGESKVKSDAKKLGSIVRFLNDSAISAKETFQMKIDFRDRSIHYNGPDGEKSETFDSLSGVELQTKGLVREGEVIFFFSPLGGLESFSIHLRDGDSNMTVAFNSMNGKVKIAGMKDEL